MKFRGRLQLGVKRVYLATKCWSCSILYLASVNLGCMSLKFGSLLSILYDQYREIGQKPWNYRNMKSDLLSLTLPDDLVRKVACLFSFCTTRNFVNAGGRVDSFDSPVYIILLILCR